MAISFNDATEDFDFAGSAYLDGKEKQLWCAEQVAFYIPKIIKDEKNKYGPRWVVDADTLDDPPEHRKLGLNCNPRRDALMEHLRRVLDDGGGVIGPVVLQSAALEGGNTVWTIVPWTGTADSAA